MQHIKLVVPGEFWDTQLYSSTLYIFDNSGGIFTINWKSFIGELFESSPDLHTVVHASFLESDLFYTASSQILLRDHQIRSIIAGRFEQLAQLELTAELTGNNIVHSANPLPFPHSDSEVYYSKLYVGSKHGIYCASCSRTLSEQKVKRIWDAPVLDISASSSYTSIAIAAGSDGLYEVAPGHEESSPRPRLVVGNPCSSSEWSGQNIIASSYSSPAFIAEFKKSKMKNSRKKSVRRFDRRVELSDVFGGTGYFWGSHDKLYMYRDNKIDCIRYSINREGKSSYDTMDAILMEDRNGKVVSANVAPFGTVLEYDDEIVVIKSNGEKLVIPGEPVNWRIFPNARYYRNQMHVIYDDRLEIYSFFHDYFVDQLHKNAGIAIKQFKG
jgi:hypothetical protein